MKTLWISLKFLFFFTLLTGILYPLLITGIGLAFFPKQSGGSLLSKNGKYAGSVLIGQEFHDQRYFFSRPSAVSYNPLPSGASNYSVTSRDLAKLVHERQLEFTVGNGLDSLYSVPPDMLFASGSGLDPQISPSSAMLQLERVARVRQFSKEQRQKMIVLIGSLTESRQFICLGEPRINVLLLNLETDKIQ